MFNLYLFLVLLPSLHNLSGVLFSLALIPTVIALGLLFFDEDVAVDLKAQKECKSVAKIGGIIFAIFLTATTVLPTQSDVMKIYGGNLILNNHQVKKLSTNSLELLNKYVTDQLKENKE